MAALKAGVPIVAVACEGKGYDWDVAAELLLHLDSKLDEVNEGACSLLRRQGEDPLKMAHILSEAVPQVSNCQLWLIASCSLGFVNVPG